MTLPQRIALIVKRGLALLHPCVYGELGSKDLATEIAAALEKEVAMLMPGKDAKALVAQFAARLPEVKRLVETDVQAAYEGDPAATSPMEVVMAYPGLYAVTIHRLAHELYNLKVPIIPRIMSELAHSKTGIDIHPGATIGERFFIDHGTGVVIGETTVIGKNVKLYQGVTLGALSTRNGQMLSGKKRHPTIEGNVTIYANATILGGDTVIGEGAVIGGNTFITWPVAKHAKVTRDMEPPKNNCEK